MTITYMNGLGEVFTQVPLATFVHAGATYYVVTDRVGAPTLIDEASLITNV